VSVLAWVDVAVKESKCVHGLNQAAELHRSALGIASYFFIDERHLAPAKVTNNISNKFCALIVYLLC